MPDLTFSQTQIDAAVACTLNTTAPTAGHQPGKDEVKPTFRTIFRNKIAYIVLREHPRLSGEPDLVWSPVAENLQRCTRVSH